MSLVPASQKTKFRRALNSLILSHPFFATMALQQKIVITESIPTMAVDGTHLYVNPKFSEEISFDENKGVIAHEIAHIYLLHHARMGKRNPKLWNKACDYAINPEIKKAGFKLPADHLDELRFHGLNAEDIYRILDQEKQEKKKNKKRGKNQSGGYSNQPGESGDDEDDDYNNFGGVIGAKDPAQAEEQAKIQSAIAQSVARAQGKLPEFIERQIANIQPKYNWRDIINRFLTEICNKDYTWSRPSRRYINHGIVLPSLYSRTYGKFILAVDTSGSIGLDEISMMVVEVLNCLGTLLEDKSDVELTVIYWDSIVQRVEVLTDVSDQPKPKGGGGTDPNPVFEYIEREGIECEGVIFLTDGYMSSIRVKKPSYQVLWGLICNNQSFFVPFGESFYVDFHQ